MQDAYGAIYFSILPQKLIVTFRKIFFQIVFDLNRFLRAREYYGGQMQNFVKTAMLSGYHHNLDD